MWHFKAINRVFAKILVKIWSFFLIQYVNPVQDYIDDKIAFTMFEVQNTFDA